MKLLTRESNYGPDLVSLGRLGFGWIHIDTFFKCTQQDRSNNVHKLGFKKKKFWCSAMHYAVAELIRSQSNLKIQLGTYKKVLTFVKTLLAPLSFFKILTKCKKIWPFMRDFGI